MDVRNLHKKYMTDDGHLKKTVSPNGMLALCDGGYGLALLFLQKAVKEAK